MPHSDCHSFVLPCSPLRTGQANSHGQAPRTLPTHAKLDILLDGTQSCTVQSYQRFRNTSRYSTRPVLPGRRSSKPTSSTMTIAILLPLGRSTDGCSFPCADRVPSLSVCRPVISAAQRIAEWALVVHLTGFPLPIASVSLAIAKEPSPTT